MPRPRSPTSILEMRGAFKVHPERKRRNEPTPNGAFDVKPPRHLSADQKKAWREVVKAVPAGVLSDADRIQVEVISCLLAEFRAAGGALDNGRITRLTTEMNRIGLNPAGRASLSIEKPKVNKYADDGF